jgi:hypothetical protein
MDQIEPTLLDGTEEAGFPFFSPDGQWIGFAAGGELKKVSVAGGSFPVTICDAGFWTGAIWGSDDTIFFSYTDDGANFSGPFRVSASGGEPEPLESSGQPEWQGKVITDVLPGGKAVHFLAGRATPPKTRIREHSRWKRLSGGSCSEAAGLLAMLQVVISSLKVQTLSKRRRLIWHVSS